MRLSRLEIKKNAGFIRIELLITIIILSLFSAVTFWAFLSAKVEARDKIRIIDAQQIQKALQIFFEENGFYPSANGDRPANFDEYLAYWPDAPAADGDCSQGQNKYNYSQRSGGSDFNLTFCLGKPQGSLAGGIHSLTSQGAR